LRRELHMPALTPGERCPVSPLDDRLDWESLDIFNGPGLGRGPVYPGMGYGKGTMDFIPDRDDWFRSKVFWYIRPSYRDRVLVRGRRLDGRGAIRFTNSGSAPRRLALRLGRRTLADWGGRPAGGRGAATGLFVRHAGCYGLQLDGATFSRTLVFEAFESEPARAARATG
jgi:hypothetical protein